MALIGAPASPAARSPAIERAPEPAKANKADKADKADKAEAPPKPAPRKAEPSAKPAVAQTDAPSKISAPMLAEANKFYASRCVPCHGTQGRGDGPAGGALTPHPRNFTDRAWQRVVTDAHIEKTILQGGPSVGKSPLMPPHSDLNGKPELLAAMRTVVRGFAR